VLFDARGNAFVLIVDAGVKPQFIDDIPALVGAAGDADHFTALDPGDLAHNAAHRSGCAGNQHDVSFFYLPDFQDTEVSRHARHTQRTDVGRHGSKVGVNGVIICTIGDGVLLYTAPAGKYVSILIFRVVVSLDDGADGAGAHHLPDLYRRNV